MEAVEKIMFEDHDCMCGEKDRSGQVLCCIPTECTIYFCPVKELIAIIQGLQSPNEGGVCPFCGTKDENCGCPEYEMTTEVEGQ